jgi:hypothetical protein
MSSPAMDGVVGGEASSRRTARVLCSGSKACAAGLTSPFSHYSSSTMIFEPTSSCSSLVGFESVLVGDEGSDRGAGGCS